MAGYVTGLFSSRKIKRATYDSVAFRYLAAGLHPDHGTLATFRRRFLDELADIFLQVLDLAREMKLLKLGMVSLDGLPSAPKESRATSPSARRRLDSTQVQATSAVNRPVAKLIIPIAGRLTRSTVQQGLSAAGPPPPSDLAWDGGG